MNASRLLRQYMDKPSWKKKHLKKPVRPGRPALPAALNREPGEPKPAPQEEPVAAIVPDEAPAPLEESVIEALVPEEEPKEESPRRSFRRRSKSDSGVSQDASTESG